jgi:flagellar hook-basal body complex protein FliE
MADIRIDDIRRQLTEINLKAKLDAEPATEGKSFSDVLQNAITDVNSDQVKAEQSMQNYITGKETSLHGTMLALEKADISFRMMMQVRNKLLDAYNEIMRSSG